MCLYSWVFLVYGHITAFIWPGWNVTSPIVLLLCAQYSPFFKTEYVGNAMLGGFSGCNVAMGLAIRSWPCILIALVLYMCTSGMVHDFPSYGCVSGERASGSSGMAWGFVIVGFFGARPGVMVN